MLVSADIARYDFTTQNLNAECIYLLKDWWDGRRKIFSNAPLVQQAGVQIPADMAVSVCLNWISKMSCSL